MGLWWINRQLSHAIGGRIPWAWGGVVAPCCALAAGAVIWVSGEPMVAALLLLYPLRMLAHRRPTSARDAKRIGLTELAWASAVTAGGMLLAS